MPFKNSTLKNNRIITAHMGDFLQIRPTTPVLEQYVLLPPLVWYMWIFSIPDPKKEMSALFSGANIVLSFSSILSK